MSVRLVITFNAEPGKGDELAQAMKERCVTSAADAGCLQFEVFRSALNPACEKHFPHPEAPAIHLPS